MMKKFKLYLFPLILALLLIPMGIVKAQTDSEYDFEYEYNSADYDYDSTKSEFDSTDTGYPQLPTDTPLELFKHVSIALWTTFTVILLGGYIFTSIALSKLGKALGYNKSWLAWIPFLRNIMILKLGDENPLFILLVLIPGVGFTALFTLRLIALANICKKRGYADAFVMLNAINLGTYILFFLLAYKPRNKKSQQLRVHNPNSDLQQNPQSPTPDLSLEEQIEQEATQTLEGNQTSPQPQQAPFQNPPKKS